MKEIINKIGELGVIKLRIINTVREEGRYKENIRNCPHYSEFYGMMQTLKILEIEYDIEWNEENTYLAKTLIINGKRFEV